MNKIFQPKDNLNQNNKFGECCGCPALMSDGHLITNWASSSIYNDEYMKLLKINNSHTYRNNLQTNAQSLMTNEHKYFDQVTCKSDKKNKFYIDSSKYSFDYLLPDGYWGNENDPYFGNKKSENKIL